MWLRTSRDTKRPTLKLGAALAVAAALALGGCSAAYVEGDAASVLLVIEAIADGAALLSDVRGAGGVILPCNALVKVAARRKNPTSLVGTSEDVRINRYDVAYRRSDGRGVQGVDIPFSIGGNITALAAAGADATELTVNLVRHQAKLEPPLSNIIGLQVVTMFADVTLYGQTISGKTVAASGSTQVTFADFADGATTCEGS